MVSEYYERIANRGKYCPIPITAAVGVTTVVNQIYTYNGVASVATVAKTLTADDLNEWPGTGAGDMVGPSGATDGHLAAYDGSTGKLLKDSGSKAGTGFGASIAGSRPNLLSLGDWGGGIGLVDGTVVCGMYTQDSGATIQFFTGQGASDAANTKLRMRLSATGLYIIENCSALSFTDRTDAFVGDALAAIEKIAADAEGNIDHASLPEFAVDAYQDEIGEWWPGRNIGNMVSILTKGLQEMESLLAEKDAQIAELAARLTKLER